MKTNKIFITLLCLLAAACTNSVRQGAGEATNGIDSSLRVQLDAATGPELVPQLASVDSLEILYFLDNEGDSSTYGRFFSYVAVADSVKVSLLIEALSGRVERLPTVKPCRSEGKIHAHNGSNPVKTIYFSTSGDCSFLYFIHNGDFCYLPVPGDFAKILNEQKSKAREPGDNGRK